MGFYVIVLDPTPNCPAGQVADSQIVGDFFDKEKLRELVSQSDITTFDIERADESLIDLTKGGHLIYPFPQILELIQNKLKQKEILTKNNIPTSRYIKVKAKGNINSFVKGFGFPVVQKACRGGYDGKGVFVIKSKRDIKKAIKRESFLEEYIDIEKELAINIARNKKGEIKCHPVVEMSFDKRANICDWIIAPARVSTKIKKEVEKIGIKTIKSLGGGAVGIFGIEMFLTKEGKVLVNEIAPRPHNSGHYTIEACITSQFEQHIRAITGLPLGSTDLIIPAVMINILGEPGYEGEAILKGVRKALSISGLSLHWYGKAITKPFRKMGHITIIDKDVKIAIKKAKKIKKILKVISKR